MARWGTTVGLRVTALTRNAATALLLREVGIETVVGVGYRFIGCR